MNPYINILRGERWEDITPLKIDGWQTVSTKSGTPNRAVEIVGINKSQKEPNDVGVRSTESVLERKLQIAKRLQIAKGEAGGHTANRFFVIVDEDLNVSLYRDCEDVQYFLTFCFDDAMFEERWNFHDSPIKKVKQ